MGLSAMVSGHKIDFSELIVCLILGKRLNVNSDKSLQSVSYQENND